MLHPRGGMTYHRTRTKFGGAGNLRNVITHAKFEINWYQIVPLAKGWNFLFSTTTADAINTAQPCQAACDISPFDCVVFTEKAASVACCMIIIKTKNFTLLI